MQKDNEKKYCMNKQRKKILFCVQDFQHGGIPKSLENLLSMMDKERYEIDIFCAYQEGSYKNVFANYSVLEQNRLLWFFCTNYRVQHGWRKSIAIAIKILRKIFLSINCDLFIILQKNIANRLSKKKYDVAIAFAEGYITHFVTYINNVERIAWIHSDYKRYLAYEKNIPEHDIYARYKYVVSPCKYSANSFLEVFPDFSNKIVAIPNILNVDLIRSFSKAKDTLDSRFDNRLFSIVSIGRVCYEKRFFEIPQIAYKLKEEGLIFCWYIIGNGPEVEVQLLRDNIKKYKVENHVVLLGAKDNPYPYIVQSDLVVMTSLSETFSYVINEAMILGTPVVSVDFGAVPEIMSEDYGMILPMEDLCVGISKIMANKEVYRRYQSNLLGFKYDNASLLKQIYALVDNDKK